MNKISQEDLGSVVEERRIQKGYTQEQLGDKTQINRQIIGRIENGKHVPSIDQLNMLMEVLGFDLKDISINEEEKNVFVSMMGEAQTDNEKMWLEHMISMMLTLRKHIRIRNVMNNEK